MYDLLTCSCQEQAEGYVKEWDGMQPPEQDVDRAYYTTVGITLFQMIEQNVSNWVYA